ncbi:MAG: ABC transporter ATP-binding protein [Proteobacteria bacterium]|nr:ABC transporter ATP-binding protein [Pseudomonadota bacterium]
MADTLLKVSRLHKSFGAVMATNNLSLDITRGHIHALIGPNGAGKTTLVNQLSGDMQADSGTIHFLSRDITRLKSYRRAQMGIARSFQITHIFENLTVAENMGLAICAGLGHNFKFWRHWRNTAAIKSELPIALERVDLIHRAELTARHLSHGEKRQLEVGMALVGKPELLILDEPMAGLGPGGTVELAKLIKKQKGRVTILLVEHDMDVVFSLADRVTVLVYGENIATGSPEEIRNNPVVRKAYLGEGG